MPIKNQGLSGLCYVAWDTQANIARTGDAGNHILRLILDGVETQPAQTPNEIDATNCPGLYKLNLAAFEMNADVVVLHGKSSSADVIIIPVQLTTSVLTSLAVTQSFGSSTPIWTDPQLEQWSTDAIGQIAIDVNCIFVRECIPTQSGVSVIRLPDYVRSLRRVCWRGRSLEPQSWEELQFLTPSTVFLEPNSSANRETIGRPLFYAPHPTNPYDVRLYPCPDESFLVSGEPNPYAPQPNSPSCIIEFWREPDPTNSNPLISIPPYILRRTQKAYVLWKAFSAEGKGQDFQASNYYQSKYNFLIDQFRAINSGCYVAKRYNLDEGGLLDPQRFRYPKPLHNPNFERTIF